MTAAAAVALCLLAAPWASHAESFEFAAIGDMPYGAEAVADMTELIAEMNGVGGLRFVVHVGDIKSGAEPCSDALLLDRKALFETSAHPFVYVPGDNEWTDCHIGLAGGYDPIERLERLREFFWSDPFSLGQQKRVLIRQSDVTADPNFEPYRENVYWIEAGVLFVALNVPGSNNGLGQHYDAAHPQADQPVQSLDNEFPTRNAANLAWLNAAFDLAEAAEAPAVVVFLQANPINYLLPTPGRLPSAENLDAFPLSVPLAASSSGYRELLLAFRARASAFAKPVLLVHGDTHTHRVDRPFTGLVGGLFAGVEADGGFGDGLGRIDNVTRLEVYGETEVKWTRVTVDTDRPAVFSFQDGGPDRDVTLTPCELLQSAVVRTDALRDGCIVWLVQERGASRLICRVIADAERRQTCLGMP